jgi:hypothetical protein
MFIKKNYVFFNVGEKYFWFKYFNLKGEDNIFFNVGWKTFEIII